MNDNEADLESYKAMVIAEIERRALRVQQLESEIARIQFAVEAASRNRKVSLAETARIQVEAAHRAKLRRDIKELEKERAIALGDLEKAQSRLQEIDERMEEMAEEQQE